MKLDTLWSAAAIAVGLLVTNAAPVEACGGFFCSQTPVLQTAERVVFEVDGDVVTAYVQLQYTGNDPNFAWIIPVPEAPQIEVGVGQGMFDALEAQTAPVFTNAPQGVARAYSSTADSAGCGPGIGGNPSTGRPRVVARSLPPPDVKIWKQEQVGPYDATTLSADSAEDLNIWLLSNGYRVQQASEPIVQDYLDAGMKLFALKLTPDAPSNAVEPIKLTYKDSRGCAAIPLKLTSIAATNNLEIITWVFGAGRAVPENFAAVEVDSTTLVAPSDYQPALNLEVDRAGGRAFVTEYAKASTELNAQGDANLQGLLDRHPYVTRLRTFIDPDEMTDDPEFRTVKEYSDVSNVIELGGDGFGASSGALLALFGLALVLRGRRS